MAPAVYTDMADNSAQDGTLFQGQKFWLSLNVPSRKSFIEKIKANGGEVVRKEADADIMLVDHLKKNAAAGSCSYKYVDLSLRNGALENLEKHRVGSAAPATRPIGASPGSAKTTRTHYTAEDDRILLEWVATYSADPLKRGGSAGNEIYKQLALHNPRHPWQSWRDRYVTQYRKRGLGVPPSSSRESESILPPPVDGASDVPNENEETLQSEEIVEVFTADEIDMLLAVSKEILGVDPSHAEDLWSTMESDFPTHTASEWQKFWEDHVRPKYLKEKEQRSGNGETSSQDTEDEKEGSVTNELENESSPGCSQPSHRSNNSASQLSRDGGHKFTVSEDARRGEAPLSGKDLPPIHYPAPRTPLKRKRLLEEVAPQSSPPGSVPRSLAKRLRSSPSFIDEIPPTPERPSEIRSHSGGKEGHGKRFKVTEWGIQEQPQEEGQNKSLDNDEVNTVPDEAVVDEVAVDGKAEGIEAEAEENARGEDSGDERWSRRRQASQTLSEPDYQTTQQDIDAQISADIMLSSIPQKDEEKDEDGVEGESEDEEGEVEITGVLQPLQEDRTEEDDEGEGEGEDGEDGEDSEYEIAPEEVEAETPEIAETQFPQDNTQHQPLPDATPSTLRPRGRPKFKPPAFLLSPTEASPERPLLPAAEIEPAVSVPNNETQEEELTESQARMNAALDAWIERQLAKGVELEVIRRAIHVTTMDLPLAGLVIMYMVQTGDGPPAEEPGVWTAEEDALLMNEETSFAQVLALEAKHGPTRMEKRMDYLEAMVSIKG